MPTGYPLTDGLFVDTAWLNATGARLLGSLSQFPLSIHADFSNIPQTYKHLLVLWKAQGAAAAATEYFGIRFNGDSSAHYLTQELSSAGAAVSSVEYLTAGGDTMGYVGIAAAGSAASANDYGVGWVVIPDYTEATSLYARWNAGSGMWSGTTTGTGRSTLIQGQYLPASIGAITRITILPKVTHFNGGLVNLYGLG